MSDDGLARMNLHHAVPMLNADHSFQGNRVFFEFGGLAGFDPA